MFTGANKQNQIVINPQNIVFARGLTNSQKDKRLTMFPEDIKQFVIDQNQEKADLQESRREPDLKTKVSISSSNNNYGGSVIGGP